MKIHLVNPPAVKGIRMVREGRCMQRAGAWTAVWAPISMALTASVLEQEGHQVMLNDCIVEGIDAAGLAEIVRRFEPDLVVLNAATPSIYGDLDRARIIKEVSPKTKVAAFGIHVTALPEDSMALGPGVDFLIRGEPEATVAELVRSGLDPKGINGMTHRDGDSINNEPDRAPMDNLDALPFPAWRHVDRKRYIMPFTNRQFLLVATGRGCPHRCAFCADPTFYGHKLRLRDPQRVADEMAWVVKEFGIGDFLFWSESFTLRREYAMSVCEAILERDLRVTWVANSRVDHVDPELLRLMKKAGCWVVGYGVESGSDRVLELMGKKTTVSDIEKAVHYTVEAGIGAVAHSVIGFPGETEDEALKTVALLKSLPLDFAQIYCAVPFPGSPLYDDARAKGYINTDDWTRFEQNHSVLDTPWLTADRVVELRARAFREFYLRPRAFLSAVRYVSSPRVALRMMKMLMEFHDWIKA